MSGIPLYDPDSLDESLFPDSVGTAWLYRALYDLLAAALTGTQAARVYVWDDNALVWARMEQPILEITGGNFTIEMEEVEALLTSIRDYVDVLDNMYTELQKKLEAGESIDVGNFPTGFDINNLPTEIEVNNFPAGFDVNNFPTGFDVDNFPTEFDVGNFPATPTDYPDSAAATALGNLQTELEKKTEPADEQKATIEDVCAALKLIADLLARPTSMNPATGNTRVEAVSGTISTVSAVTTAVVSNVTALGAVNAAAMPWDAGVLMWAQCVRTRIT
jgi:hypothetical protein